MAAGVANINAALRAIERQQADILRQMDVLKRRFRELERQRKTVLRRIEKVSRTLERISGEGVSQEMIRKVESVISREGWMERIIENRFKAQAEHGPGSEKWAKLAPSTVKRKGFNRILFETGNMFSDTLQAVSGTYRMGKIPKWNVSMVSTPYAAYMQDGTDRAPARPFINPPNEKEMKPVEARVRQLLRAEIRKAFKPSNN